MRQWNNTRTTAMSSSTSKEEENIELSGHWSIAILKYDWENTVKPYLGVGNIL